MYIYIYLYIRMYIYISIYTYVYIYIYPTDGNPMKPYPDITRPSRWPKWCGTNWRTWVPERGLRICDMGLSENGGLAGLAPKKLSFQWGKHRTIYLIFKYKQIHIDIWNTMLANSIYHCVFRWKHSILRHSHIPALCQKKTNTIMWYQMGTGERLGPCNAKIMFNTCSFCCPLQFSGVRFWPIPQIPNSAVAAMLCNGFTLANTIIRAALDETNPRPCQIHRNPQGSSVRQRAAYQIPWCQRHKKQPACLELGREDDFGIFGFEAQLGRLQSPKQTVNNLLRSLGCHINPPIAFITSCSPPGAWHVETESAAIAPGIAGHLSSARHEHTVLEAKKEAAWLLRTITCQCWARWDTGWSSVPEFEGNLWLSEHALFIFSPARLDQHAKKQPPGWELKEHKAPRARPRWEV